MHRPWTTLFLIVLFGLNPAVTAGGTDPKKPICEWTVTVVGASHLKNHDWGKRKLSDPYVEVREYPNETGDRFVGAERAFAGIQRGWEWKNRFVPDIEGEEALFGKTQVAFNNLSPQWNHVLKTRRYLDEGLGALIFLVWDDEVKLPPQRMGFVMLRYPRVGTHRIPLHQMIGKRQGAPGELIVEIERSTPEVTVPDLLGLTEGDARRTLITSGFRDGLQTEFVTGALDRGVIRQSPEAGARAPIESTVTFVIQAERTYPVPDLVGLTEAAARRRSGEVKPLVRYRQSDASEIDSWFKVVSQTREPGELIPAATAWEIFILKPAAGTGIALPDLRGKPLRDAKRILAGRYLNLLGAEREETPPEKAGIVLRQEPDPGTKIPFGGAAGVNLVYGYHADGLSYDSAKKVAAGEPFTCDFGVKDKAQYRRIEIPGPGYLVFRRKRCPGHITVRGRFFDPNGDGRGSGRLNCARRVTPGEWTLAFDVEYHMATGDPVELVTEFVPEFDPAEPNDGFETAAPIGLPARLTIGLCPTGDADFYRFTAEKPGYLFAAVEAFADAEDAKGRLAVGLEVFDAEKKRIARGDLRQVRWLPAGEYFLRFSGGNAGYDTRPYGISLGFEPDTDGTEPNDTIEAATVIAVPASKQVRYTTGDVDFYRLVAEEPGWVVISHPRKLGPETWVRPIDAEGKGPVRYKLPCAVAVDPECVVRLTTEAQYRPSDSWDPVDLNLVFVPRTEDRFEPNDDPAAAPAVVVNATHEALLLPVRDVECYRFRIAKAGPVTASLPRAYPGQFFMARLFDASGKPLEERADYVPRKWDLEPGEYVVRFHQHSGDWNTSLHPYAFRIDAPNEPAVKTGDRYSTPEATGDAAKGLDLARRAYAHYLRKEFTAAADLYEQASVLLPDCAALWNDFGSTCFRLGSMTDAEAYYRKAVELDPDYGLALRNLGVVSRQKGDLAGYVEWTEKAVEADRSAVNLRFHGHALAMAGEAAEDATEKRDLLNRAVAAFRESLEKEGDAKVRYRIRRIEVQLERLNRK